MRKITSFSSQVCNRKKEILIDVFTENLLNIIKTRKKQILTVKFF